MVNLLDTGPADGPCLLFAHGAGAPMDSVFMHKMAELLGERGVRVLRFEFAYMAARRQSCYDEKRGHFALGSAA